jgi:phytanoyl-CoA hydroxylase
MQTMLFDLGTASGPRQDRYDLDCIPNGAPIAACVALEDIREEAGRFYVMPGSHQRWIKRVGDYVEQHRSSRFAPALRQGDVLLWNPRAVHGSLPTRDERYSRKSLTAHYLPSHQGFDKHYKEYEGVRFYRNQPEYSLLNHVVYALKARLRQGSA